MPTITQSRRKLKSRLDAKQDVWRAIPALMGNGSGVVEIPNQPGYVYIRLGDNDLGQAFNNRCPLTDDLAIYVGYDPVVDPDRRVFQVLSVRMADYAGGGSTPVPNVGAHHTTHEFGGGDDVYVDWRRLMGLRVGRPILLTVTVDQGVIFRGGVWLPVTSQTTPPLTVPGLSTQAYYALIALDSAGVVTIAYGPPVAIATLTIANCPVPAAGEIPLAAVRLHGGQTVITDIPSAPDIVDLRFPTYNTMSLYVTPHNVLSASHIDSLTGVVLDGDVIIGNVTPAWSKLGILIPAANVRNALGIDNAELRPSWKTTLDATNPTTIGIGDAGGPGTSLIYSHRDHQHPSPSTWTATAHAIDGAIHTVAGRTAGQVLIATAAATFGWSGFLLSGTAGGSINFAVTNAKTLTLTSADDFNLTAERTGAVIVRTIGAAPAPQIVGDAVGAGLSRGQYAVDLQLARVAVSQVASGDYASIGGGYNNLASGNYSSVPGGYANNAAGVYATAFGDMCSATGDSSLASGLGSVAGGNYSVALGRYAKTGAYAGVFIYGGSINADFNGIVADEFAIRSRGGFRHAYDDSNYWQVTVSAAGAVVFNATGASAGFSFSDVVTIPANGLIVTGMARGDILAGNATPAFARLALGGITGSVLTRDATDVLWSAGALSFAGAFTLTVPATGTAALLGTANVFTADQTIDATHKLNLLGGQIAFPAIQVPSANVNTLDDYEEGTVDVTLTCGTSGTITLTNKTLAYTKIGRLVTVSGYIDVASVSSPVGFLQLNGLPFTSGTGTQFFNAVQVYGNNLAATAATALQGYVNNNATTVLITKFAAGAQANLANDVQATTQLVFSILYFAAA